MTPPATRSGLFRLASAFFCAVTGLLGACSLPQRLDGGDDGSFEYRPVSGGARRSGEGEAARGAMHTELIQTMLAQQQYYAALAHLEQRMNESGATPELRYLEAEVRRRLGQNREAEAIYQSLLRKAAASYGGQAYHGLGLLAAQRKDYPSAVQHLRAAAGRRPTDGEIRNDLGYALMLAGRYAEALPEIATAVELGGNDNRSSNNLVVLLMLTKDETRAHRVAAESGIGAAELARLRKQAQSLARARSAGQEKAR